MTDSHHRHHSIAEVNLLIETLEVGRAEESWLQIIDVALLPYLMKVKKESTN